MPLYVYCNPATGETLEMVRPIACRDVGAPPGFKRIPAVPGVIVAHRQPPTLAQEVRRGYYDAEQRDGSRFQSGFTKKEIAAAWNEK